MKKKNFMEQNKRLLNIKKEKLDEKQKDKNLINLSQKYILTQGLNNPKAKRNNISTELNTPKLTRRKSEQKYKVNNKYFEEKNTKKDKPRLFSQSPSKHPPSGGGKERTLVRNNLTETRLITVNKNESVKGGNLRGKRSRSKKKHEVKKEENKATQIPDENYDPNLYGFNLYKNIKENLKNKEKLCKDNLTKESFYCLDCKLSTCKRCPNFNVHRGHNLIPKYTYYSYDEKKLQDTFDCIDKLLEENPDYINNKILRDSLKKTVTDSIDKLINRLNDIKNQKLKELDKLFESSDGCLDALKEKEKVIKNDIKNYLEKQNDFYFLKVEEEPNLNDPDYDVLKNLNLGNKESNPGMVVNNKDTYNSVFLINYDIYKNTAFINSEIRNLMNDIQTNRDKYLTEFNLNLKIINENVDKFSQQFNGLFNFGFLNTEFYKMVNDKLKKYNEKIDGMRQYIFDMVNKDGNYDKIDKDIRMTETNIKQYFDNILNYQYSDDDIPANAKLKGGKYVNNFHRLSMYLNVGLAVDKLRNNMKNNGCLNKNKDGLIYDKPEDVKLDKEILQRYFAYETYNTVHNYFRYKKPKSEMEAIEEEFDEDTDVAKPIPGTNEMQLYDKRTTTMTKKIVKFEKKKHKYTYFLNGCRSVLVKDVLYILGGVDKEKKPTKMAYAYYIKTNELKLMPEMLSPHAYHSVQFLDYYKSIIVVGGENCSSCELYDFNTGLWRGLPELNIPRATCSLYLDKFTHAVYSFFGIIGNITEKNNFTDVIECLELKRLSLGWCKVEYNNKAEMDFKSGYNNIISLSPEMLLIYGAQNMRDFVKKAAVYLIPKFEIVKIDNRIYAEIKETSKYSRKLSKILDNYI